MNPLCCRCDLFKHAFALRRHDVKNIGNARLTVLGLTVACMWFCSVVRFLGSTAQLKNLASLHDYTSHILILVTSLPFVTLTSNPKYVKTRTQPLSIFKPQILFLKLSSIANYVTLTPFHVISNSVSTNYRLIWRYWQYILQATSK
jgi:Na+/serine symporter